MPESIADGEMLAFEEMSPTLANGTDENCGNSGPLFH